MPDKTVMRRLGVQRYATHPTAAHTRRNGNAEFRRRWHVGHAPTLHPGRQFQRQQTIAVNGNPN
jgi:hypothetical protein